MFPHDLPPPRNPLAQIALAELICRRNKAHLTPLRKDVLNLIMLSEGPITAYQLLSQLKAHRITATAATIYRTLDFLMGAKLVHRIESLNAFVACLDAEHGHTDTQFLICTSCGAVTEIEDHGIALALLEAARQRGFALVHGGVEMTGLCATCYAKPRLAPANPAPQNTTRPTPRPRRTPQARS